MSFSTKEIWKEFSSSGIGLVGIGILVVLFCMSIVAFIVIPAETFKEWNDPASWLTYPKSALPIWVNYFLSNKIPEHMILKPQESYQKSGNVSVVTDVFAVDYEYDSFPSDFIYQYSVRYTGAPLVQLLVTRPDGLSSVLISTSLPYSYNETMFSGMLFSTDDSMKKNLENNILFSFPVTALPSQNLVFSDLDQNKALKGHYIFKAKIYDIDGNITPDQSTFVLGGKAYGLMGTDELRRDLAVGILWGTPLALFIGITVSIGSVTLGLVYGVFAGFKGKTTDEA